MYEYFEFNIEDAQFEWDEEKDHLNFTKHGIYLEELERCCLWYAH